jgi:crotonobetainyl-CoA:carnitine CoA-transferase CaiB-like acyl-CoA transferase
MSAEPGHAGGPLAGLRVVELALEIQGPYAGQTLAGLGAEVIKIETPGRGDTSRAVPLARILGSGADRGEFSHYFYVFNRGKRSLTLDLKSESGKEVLHRLLVRSDVLISNFRPGVLERLGLGYELIAARHPRLIYAMGSGWGPRGPRTLFPSRDMLAQAASGLMAKTGDDPQPPTPAPTVIGDCSGAHMLVTAVLAALYARERTGRGQRLDVSLYGTVLSLQPWEIFHTHLVGREPARAGYAHALMKGAWGAFRAADGWLVLSSLGDDHWPQFCRIIGREDLLADPRWTMYTRNIVGDELHEILIDAFLGRTCDEWMAEFGPAGILITEAVGWLDVLEDEQARESGYIAAVEHPDYGPMKLVGSPMEFSGTRAHTPSKAPALGEDNAAILEEAGFSPAEIESLRAEHVI